MPIDLHPDCKARVIELLTQALPKIDVTHGKFIKRSTEGILRLIVANQALPQKGPVHDSLLAYIDENPLLDFINDTLTDELRSAPYLDAESQPLTSIEGYTQAADVADRLIEKLIALPDEYRLSFRLPKTLWSTLSATNTMADLGPRIRLVRSNPDLIESMPLEASDKEHEERLKGGALLASLFDPNPPQWEEGAAYLQVDATGFIGGYGGSIPDSDSRRTLRSFCGLGLALRLFDINNKYQLAPPRSHYFVHRKNADDIWTARERFELDDSLSRGLERVSLNMLDGWIDSTERQASWSARILEEMKGVFSAGKMSEPILLASQWYFDSATGADELLQYVQAMIVLEILLGDKATSKEIGLNELLRNRCAYLIGNSQQDRAELHKFFGEIYDVRSQIVHRGKHRLSVNERSLLNRLRWMCRRVIQKEVDLLIADKKTA
jgi:hypothetical protein